MPREFARTRIAWSELAMATLIGPAVSLSEPFEDGIALLRVAELQGLEGVAPGSPYRSGECRGWRKVKTVTWREANQERWRLFEPSR